MTDIIYDMIVGGVDLLFSSLILATIALLLRYSVVLTSTQVANENNIKNADYYREFSIYDNKSNLSREEVCSALVKYRDSIKVVVDLKEPTETNHNYLVSDIENGCYYLLGNVSRPDNYVGTGSSDSHVKTIAQVKEMIGSDYLFDSILYEYLEDLDTEFNKSGVPVEQQSHKYYDGGKVIMILFKRNK